MSLESTQANKLIVKKVNRQRISHVNKNTLNTCWWCWIRFSNIRKLSTYYFSTNRIHANTVPMRKLSHDFRHSCSQEFQLYMFADAAVDDNCWTYVPWNKPATCGWSPCNSHVNRHWHNILQLQFSVNNVQILHQSLKRWTLRLMVPAVWNSVSSY